MERLTLAIVDDEQDILRSLNRLFRNDYNVHTFDNGKACLDFIEDNPVDLVLSDIRMPFMDGFELMAQLKAHYPEITRLCISGYADVDKCQQAIEEGLFEHIVPKPWDNFELKNIVRLFAENRRLKHQLSTLATQVDSGG